jgi:hypothetical protein
VLEKAFDDLFAVEGVEAGKFFGSAHRLDARAQGVVRVHVWGQTVTSIDPTEARKATVRRFGRGDRSAQHRSL